MTLRELHESLQTELSAVAETSALLDLNPETAKEYIVFTVTDQVGEGGDDAESCRIAAVTVYYVCPLEFDSLDKRAAVREACEGLSDTLVRETDQGGYVQCWVYGFQRVIENG